jgi:hypothetical protein
VHVSGRSDVLRKLSKLGADLGFIAMATVELGEQYPHVVGKASDDRVVGVLDKLSVSIEPLAQRGERELFGHERADLGLELLSEAHDVLRLL